MAGGSARTARSLSYQTNQNGRVRRMRVNCFPYGVWYAVEGDTIVVYAFAHLHRKPRRYR